MASVWTAPITWTSLNIVTAAQLNAQVRDNLTFLHTFRGAMAYRAADMTIADSTWTDFTMDQEIYDTDGYHSTVTNNQRFTVPSGLAGYYLLGGEVHWAGNGTGQRLCRIYLNNTTQISGFQTSPTNANTIRFGISVVYHLAVGDYVTFGVDQTSGGNLAALGTIAETHFRMAWLGV